MGLSLRKHYIDSLHSLSDQFHSDGLLPEINRGFGERVGSANLEDPEVRDLRTNPRVLEHRVNKEKVLQHTPL